MGATGVEWGPALLVLAAAIILGALLSGRLRTSARAAAPALPLEARDLAAQRDALLRQLHELEDTALKRTPAQLALERQRLELEAARAWRELDARLAAAPAPVAVPPAAGTAAAVPAPAPASALRGFLWGTGSMAAIGLLLFLVWQSAQPREQGGSLTGSLPQSSGAPDAEEAPLREAIARNPDDFEARLKLARLYLSREDMMSVFNETKYVLERQPGHPQALAYQALVRLAMGQSEMAVGMLKEALKTAPDYFEGYVHLMLVHVRMGRPDEAQATAEEGARRFPQEAERLRSLLARMKVEVPAEGSETADAAGDPHAGVGAPEPAGGASRGGQAPAAGGASGPTLGIEIDLDPALRGQLPAGTTLFVIVREAGIAKGPPRAVKRIAAASFPLSVTLGDADSMAGEPLPAAARVEARADSDGDPLTRPASDPTAFVDGVKLGAGPVRLVLRR
jgi:cytochrome c-type biogenesis protein CcmH